MVPSVLLSYLLDYYVSIYFILNSKQSNVHPRSISRQQQICRQVDSRAVHQPEQDHIHDRGGMWGHPRRHWNSDHSTAHQGEAGR